MRQDTNFDKVADAHHTTTIGRTYNLFGAPAERKLLSLGNVAQQVRLAQGDQKHSKRKFVGVPFAILPE